MSERGARGKPPPGLSKMRVEGMAVVEQDRELLCLKRMEQFASRRGGPPEKFPL